MRGPKQHDKRLVSVEVFIVLIFHVKNITEYNYCGVVFILSKKVLLLKMLGAGLPRPGRFP